MSCGRPDNTIVHCELMKQDMQTTIVLNLQRINLQRRNPEHAF